MAVANPCTQEEWHEWEEEMEENRRRRWRVSVKRAEEEEEDEENFEEETEEDEQDWMEMEDDGVQREVKVVKEGIEVAGAEGLGENKVEDEDIEKEIQEAEEPEEGKEESESDIEREVEEDQEAGAIGEENRQGDNLITRAVTDNEAMQEELGYEDVRSDGEDEETGEENGREAVETGVEKEWEVTDDCEVGGVEEREPAEAEEEGEREREGQREVETTEELEEGAVGGENELDVEVRSIEEVDEEDDEEWEEEDDLDWFQDQEQFEEIRLAQQFGEERRFDWDDLQLNQDDTMQGNRMDNEEVNLLGSVMSNYESSDTMGSDNDWFSFERSNNDGRSAGRQHKNQSRLEAPESISVSCVSKERRGEEDRSEKFRDKPVAKLRGTQEDESHDEGKNVWEEDDESTEDENAEYSDEEEPDYEEDVAKTYCKDDYSVEVFRTLTEFKDSSLLTDLTLRTKDGESLQVHSPVLAAVSSLIRGKMRGGNVNHKGIDGRKYNDLISQVPGWSLSLGPEVDRAGLEGVVEFAYTGLISCLWGRNLNKIKAAAQTLGAPRVLDFCTMVEKKPIKTRGRKEEGIPAEEQMSMSLQCMKEQWTDGVGCDVVLDAVGGSLHAHRVILAVGSDYFRSMFTLGMRESNQPCVALPFLPASELQALIGCFYSGDLPLSWKSVFEITSTALQLQCHPALSLCLNFLQQEINPDSCLDVASFAEAYEMVQLLEVADDFVLRQFQKVACTPKFTDLPANKLLKYLNSLSLCVSSELVVFKAVVAWIQAKPKKRLKLAKELMKTIHFPLMTFKEFKEVQSLNMWSDESLTELFEAIFEDFCSNDTAPQSQCRIYLPKESLVLVGGEQVLEDLGKCSVSRELWFGNSLRNHTGIRKAMEWRKLGEMPEQARFRHEVAVLKGQLYVFGGKNYYGINDTLNSVFRYDPLENTWESLPDMLDRRSAFSVVVLDGKLIAIAGQCEPYYWDSVEEYCPDANAWRFTWPLDVPLGGHVARVVRGQIFVSGGLNNDYKCVSSMFLYHPEKGSTYLANMCQPRAYHCMETLGEYLYVAGGITTDESVTIVDQLACEVYSPANDSWTAFTSLRRPHVGAGSAVLEGKLYVLGGYSLEDCSNINTVHRYDTSTCRWENMGRMPGPNNDIRASVLCLPQHFRL